MTACKVEGCCREVMYVKQQVCQMHYFRFMRTGSYDLKPKTRKERIENEAGPELPLGVVLG